ncbi:hypothetical protein TorRG33x02_319340 [Trema orientale]|uniref:Uncharacterized protein n=1 Tax=Trema orientale TaxID=63057 RepID=A0A2P5BIT9_TREOI|nr:hypothetical protein TorRG33x02_319340 [Trema orientale]
MCEKLNEMAITDDHNGLDIDKSHDRPLMLSASIRQPQIIEHIHVNAPSSPYGRSMFQKFAQINRLIL